jgi:hypothetical protein
MTIVMSFQLGKLSRRTKFAENVLWMGEMKNEYKILVEKLKGRDHLGDLGVGGRIILIWTSKKCVRSCGLNSAGSG